MSRNYLDKDEFVPFAPKNIGEEVHVHHCKLGKNNDRLYIRRNEDGSIMAYCHHCGMRGISKLDGVRHISNFRSSKSEDVRQGYNKTLKLPSDLETDFDKWPKKAQMWPLQYGITKEEIHVNHMGYSEYFGRVVLPSFDEKGVLSEYQTRKINGLNGTASFQRDTKYDTYIKQGSTPLQRVFNPRFTWADPYINPNILCIVEDNLSAIKCNRYTPTIALHGTSLDMKSIIKLSKQYTDFIIFLDNDNPQVKKSQSKLKRKLELVCKGNVKIVYSDKDPKELSNKELKEILL